LEFFLEGRVKPIPGSLPMAIQARGSGYGKIVLPAGCAKEAAMVEGISVLPVSHLSEVVEYLSGKREIEPVRMDREEACRARPADEPDFSEVKGQEHAIQALCQWAFGDPEG
jgi:magnesium chelatase family protein